MRNETIQSGLTGTAAAKVGGAVGLFGPKRLPRRWYIAIVNNNTEKACAQRLMKTFAGWVSEGKNCEVYVPVQRELRRWRNGRRAAVDRIILPTFVFVRCTEAERRHDVAYIPFIKRFFVNIAGAAVNGHRPVAVIPDSQMAALRRMVEGADDPVTINARPLRLGERVRVNGGKLVGLEGNVYRESDGSTHLVIKIDILGCAMVKIARDLLEPLPPEHKNSSR